MSESLFIGDRPVGAGHPTYVIAEIGVNHNGDMRLAQDMLKAAAEAGADAAKFQTFRSDRVVTGQAEKAAYQKKVTDPEESQAEMLQRLELTPEDHHRLLETATDLGIQFLSTPYNAEDADFLEQMGLPALKLASMHAAEPPLLAYVAGKGLPLILSTGMTTLGEVDAAVQAIQDGGAPPLVLLQCTTNYPASLGDANLRAMDTLAQTFGRPVGYSDHTEGEIACLAAVARGACVIEKHFTLDRSLPGPDHATSSEPDDFARLVHHIRETERTLGSRYRRPTEVERANMVGMRRSIVTNQAVPAGAVLSEDMLVFKRPATGIPPRDLPAVLGRRTSRALAADQILDWADIGEHA